jgi:CBS-domain-containing membrane protein
MERHHTTQTIRQVMTNRPTTVGHKTSVRTLRALFIAYGFNAFPVVDEAGALLGIVTKLDLLRVFRHDPRRLLPELTAISAEHVDDIMRRRVVTVAPDEPVTTAVDRMLSARLHSLPVVERRSGRDRVIGIVSRGDVLRGLTFESDDPE